MSYPGNSSLGDEVRQRILSTFSQSLDLAETGKVQEAALGCDFILELDPEFEPARLLKERLESEADGQEVDDLRAIARGETPPAPAPSTPDEPSPDDLFDLEDFDLPGLDEDVGNELDEAAGLDPVAAPGPSPEPPEAPAPEADLRAELEELMKARSFQEVMDRASRHRDEVVADPELTELVREAQSRLEAHPYVESFIQKTEAALREGDVQTAHAVLDKARSLEPDHPRIVDLAAEIAAASSRAGSGLEAAPDATADPAGGATAREAPGRASEGVEADAGPGGEPSHEDDRIAQLLAEGQEAADRGDHQSAIDAWSRIFLIDVDHEEAARRIEKARRSKAERERQVEEIFHEGLDALEGDDRETARERFERVLEVQPNHLAAREYLQQIESGGPVTGPGSSPEQAADVQDLGSFDLEDLAEEEDREASEEPLKQEILVPPAPGEVREIPTSEGSDQEAATPRRMAAGSSSGLRSFVLIGGAVLVLVLAAGWFLLQNRERFFPNSSADDAASAERQDAGPTMLERALELHEGGRTRMAVGLLKRIRPDQADYQRAQELIAEWEAPAEDEAVESSEPTISAAELARRDDLIARARQAFDRSEYLLALEFYDDARDIAPLEGESRERFRQAAQQLEALSSQIELFHQGEYEMVMPELWRMLEDDPTNRDARRLLVDSYYNRGVRELQRGDAGRAAAEFREALSLAPDDREIQRHFQFAQTYQQRSKDLLYRIYVKYLPFR